MSCEVRIVIDPRYRTRGLGSLSIRELKDIALRDNLERIIFQLVEGKQDDTINIARLCWKP